MCKSGRVRFCLFIVCSVFLAVGMNDFLLVFLTRLRLLYISVLIVGVGGVCTRGGLAVIL